MGVNDACKALLMLRVEKQYIRSSLFTINTINVINGFI